MQEAESERREMPSWKADAPGANHSSPAFGTDSSLSRTSEFVSLADMMTTTLPNFGSSIVQTAESNLLSLPRHAFAAADQKLKSKALLIWNCLLPRL